MADNKHTTTALPLTIIERLRLNGELKSAVDSRNAESNSLKRLGWVKVVQDLRAKLGLISAQSAAKAPPVVEALEPAPTHAVWDAAAIMAAKYTLKSIQQYIPVGQYATMLELLAGEEGESFAQTIKELKATILGMPKIGATDDQGDGATVGIHYFGGPVDVWVTELDSKTEEAFGAVSLGYEPELGYLSIAEYVDSPVMNIDLYWNPKSLNAATGNGGQSDDKKPDATQTAIAAKLYTKKDTSGFYEHAEKRTKGQRQKANNAAIALLEQFRSGEREYESVTDEERAILAKYTGSGGNLTTVDGKKGSAYEYYTPKPIAEGIWTLLDDLGFAGGKVLDPCAGVGIFGATSPQSAAMDAVELDGVSGGVNQLVNGGVGHNVTISAFEDVAANTPDGTHDAVVTNVPFGDNSARGGNQFKDERYQNHSLESYFMLRSMDKLKPKGLAAFIVPPRVVSGLQSAESKLRQRLSLKGEFMGAYRLPNSVFGAASADTITDIVVLRKHSREVLAKIDELYSTNPDALREANVLWAEFLEGKYFKGEGRRFVLGEFVAKDPAKYRDVDRVISDQSTANIGKLLRKFGTESRINFAALDVADGAGVIAYADGDTIALNGQILTYSAGAWETNPAKELEHREIELNQGMATIHTPLNVINTKMTWGAFDETIKHMHNIGKSLDMPAWASKVHASLKGSDKAVDWFEAIVTGLAAKDVQVENADETDANLVELYAVLAAAMKRNYKVKPNTSVDGESRAAVKFIGIHYSAKTGFSDYWQGKRQAAKVDLDTSDKLARTQYITGSLNIEFAKAKTIVEADGGVFDPLNDDDWMMSADGKTVIRADDYFVGNLGDALAKLNTAIENAASPEIKAKLQRMQEVAVTRGNPITVENMTFDLRSPMVHPDEALQFFKAFVSSDSSIRQNDKNKRQYVDVDIRGSSLSLREKLLNRVGDYMKNGTITIGGLDVSPLTEEEALQELDKMVRQLNTQYNVWVKANPIIMSRLNSIARDPNNIYFKQADDKSKFQVDGISPEWNFHGYQCAFARRMSRRFSGINGFDVGLGKTATALMSVQYVHNIGVKRKTLFLVPGSVLSNWRKEAVRGEGTKGEPGYKAPVYDSENGCLFVGLTVGKDGSASVKSQDYDRDLNVVLENKHNKVFMSYEAFQRIRMKDETIDDYSDYLRSVDSSYARAVQAAEDEKNKSKLGDLIKVIRGNKSSTAAPYFEDMGFDSIVIDEAHSFKNSKETVDFEGGKFLSTAGASTMGLDAQAKVWFIRKESPNGDGVLALTATPITNSPLEIYAMLTLSAGEERVNKMMLGATGSDAFMEMVCSFEEQLAETVDGKVKSYRTFTGLKNLAALRQGLHDVAVIENAESVGNDFTIPDAPETATPVRLSRDTEQRLKNYKIAYSVARALETADKTNTNANVEIEDFEIYNQVMLETGETQRLMAQPFNLINKMNNLIVDPDLNEKITVYITDNQKAAEEICNLYNKKNILDVRKSLGKHTSEDDLKKTAILKDSQGDVIGSEYTVHTKAVYDGQRIVLNSSSFNAQMALEALIDAKKLDVDMTIPPKFAALIENIKAEQGSPRGIDGARRSQKAVKQIVFCDMLSSHTKIKRLLAKHCGIPASKITFISGQYNNEPEALLDVQAGFNAGDDENLYQIIVANKKAEVGINLQKGCQAIHHLTIGWTPDSLQQRNGRGVRQGNLTGYVSIYHYDADGTFDTYRRRLVNKKSAWIDSLLQVDGENEVDVSGGLTKEQQDALINMVGDNQAMANFQDTIDAQDRARRTEATRAAQDVNIKTFIATSRFLKNNAEFEKYADVRAKAYLELHEEYYNARETLEKSIFKGVSQKTIDKNAAKFNGLKLQISAALDEMLSTFELVIRREKVPVEDAHATIIEAKISKWSLEFRIKAGEIDSPIKRQWQNEMETNRRMMEAVDDALNKSLTKTGAYSQLVVEAAKNREALRFKGNLVSVGGVAKRVDANGVESYALIEVNQGTLKLRYFKITTYGENRIDFKTDTYGDWRASTAAQYLASNQEEFIGIYNKTDPEYQQALAYFASYDNAVIASRAGQLTEDEQKKMAAHFIPELANMHTTEVVKIHKYQQQSVVFADKNLFPIVLIETDVEEYVDDSAEHAKWERVFVAQSKFVVEYGSGYVVANDPDVFEPATAQDAATKAGMLFSQLSKHGLKAQSLSRLAMLFHDLARLNVYALITASNERGIKTVEQIEAATTVDEAVAISNSWAREVFEAYVVEAPSFEVVLENVTGRDILNLEIMPIKNAIVAKEISLRVKSPDDYVYMTGDTRAAFNEIPFRELAKQSDSEIAWYPAGNKAPRTADAKIIAKAPMAPKGVWVFQRKLWTHLQENFASEIAQFNLDTKEGN